MMPWPRGKASDAAYQSRAMHRVACRASARLLPCHGYSHMSKRTVFYSRIGMVLCSVLSARSQLSSSARGDDAATRYGRVDDVRCPAVRDLLGSCRIETSDSSSAEATLILGISRHGFPSSSHATVRTCCTHSVTLSACAAVCRRRRQTAYQCPTELGDSFDSKEFHRIFKVFFLHQYHTSYFSHCFGRCIFSPVKPLQQFMT
jgi:hypothetical protein